jgi:thiamine-phosphate pyrophosphorylase
VIPRGLYGMADAGFGDVLAQARLFAEEGVGIVQLRCKGWDPARLLETARSCADLGVLVVVNDDVAVARAAGSWVHLGQEDGPDPDVPFGRSCHTIEQVVSAGSAAYVGFGPVFGTTTKDTGYAARGCALLREAVASTSLPIVAIGGITPDTLDEVRATGVHAWAAIGAIWTARDPRAAIRALHRP